MSLPILGRKKSNLILAQRERDFSTVSGPRIETEILLRQKLNHPISLWSKKPAQKRICLILPKEMFLGT